MISNDNEQILNLAGTTFCSGLLTDAEFHAGKNFFGMVYKDFISFNEENVILSKKVILPFKPMDPSDIDWFNNYKIEGSYSLKDNYIECYFKVLSWRFSGFIEEIPEKILILSNFDERLRTSWSVVYEEFI